MKRFAYLGALVASLVLAIGSTAAMGAGHPDDRATHGPGAVDLEQANDVVRPDDRATHGQGAITLEQANDAVRPDDRATHGLGAITVEQTRDAVRPDDRTTHGPGAVTFEQVTRPGQAAVIAPGGTAAERVDGFDWLDAGIGAAAALGLGLIAAGGAALLLRRGHSPAYS